ncbi:hypothetical protein Goari_004241 [Gossypium aridum]|uniref:Uncharacterized protein n=1 Tax=Gossypium aridum TaxID=34290 RepID=A0A7J8Y4J8_GOSAI|nr:hypothetical protein [Gossypium aridum]
MLSGSLGWLDIWVIAFYWRKRFRGY